VRQQPRSPNGSSVAAAIAVGGIAVGFGLLGVALAFRRLALGESSRDGVGSDRALLDRGAVLLTDLTKAVAETDSDDRARLPSTAAWEHLGRELAVFQGQLSLAFDEHSEVAVAFEDAVELTDWRTSWVGELGPAAHPGAEGRSRHRAPDDALGELVEARQRYLTAARSHLRRRAFV
jgi:hypothetical protein